MIRRLLCFLQLCPVDELRTYFDPEDGFFFLRCPHCDRIVTGLWFSRLL